MTETIERNATAPAVKRDTPTGRATAIFLQSVRFYIEKPDTPRGIVGS